ncbi:hypothetical protein QBC33DRAFT_548156 [Phialemonium atrogriseum]|uniref:Uncharacterized protein n=1 Tax=Phialemonium atrogriseum TaxID=1093897 RepID=A0AAJ0FJ86_9PEZI|nr:uncharacterized protein QBC33DRAFT_548156 [Phialemonium atrogriseum]KAK1764129.1 hypothetical protein QBC33DRAFT_548156 [Phialemonium atrogriseum]
MISHVKPNIRILGSLLVLPAAVPVASPTQPECSKRGSKDKPWGSKYGTKKVEIRVSGCEPQAAIRAGLEATVGAGVGEMKH